MPKAKYKIIHPWERDKKCNSSKSERSLMLSHLDTYKYEVGDYDGLKIKSEWINISETIIQKFLNEKDIENWLYVGSNDSEFLQFIAFDVPLTMAFTDKVLVANTTQQDLIRLFLSQRPTDVVTEDLAGAMLYFKRISGLLVFEDFLAPNISVPKFIGNFNDVFSKRAELHRPTLFLDLRPSAPQVDNVLDAVEQMYGKRVKCFFERTGVFKYYSFKIRKKEIEMEKVI